MSEYQYYEFQAIDRPLTAGERNKLRAYSTRATITATSFVNEYDWGSFKGDEFGWMVKYFDAFLHVSGWGSRAVRLRLPSKSLDATTARLYCGGDSASMRVKPGKLILSFESVSDEAEDWDGGGGRLASMIGVRGELARGDLRPLYLGWLLRAQSNELRGTDREPPVPPGLDRLSAPQESLATFLRIDLDLLRAAAGAVRPEADPGQEQKLILAWVAGLPARQKDKIITKLLTDPEPTRAELLKRYHGKSPKAGPTPEKGRTVDQLWRAAAALATDRRSKEREKRAREERRFIQAQATARGRYLDSLAGREAKLWARVGRLVANAQTPDYDQAVNLLVDLRDLEMRRKGRGFAQRLEDLRLAHARKSSFLKRVRKAGL